MNHRLEPQQPARRRSKRAASATPRGVRGLRTPALLVLAVTTVLAAPPLLRSSGLAASSDSPAQSTVTSAAPVTAPTQTAPGTAAASAAGQLKLPAVADTYVVRSEPTVGHGGRTSMFATTSENRAFVRFNTRGAVPAGQKVVAASLRVYVLNVAVASAGFEVHPASNGWQEATLTYANRPAFTADTVTKSAAVTAEAAWLTVPLTSPSAVSTTAATSFELMHRTPSSQLQLATREGGRAAELVLTLGAAAPGTPSPTVPPSTAPTSTASLPFDLPAGLATSKRLAFAHYFTPFPISIDNKEPAADYYTRNYLSPWGESGKHLAYGGLLRDRPIGRAPLSGDYQLQDFKTEVRQARAAGLDGFTVDILSLTSYHWDRVKLLLEAAHQADPSFKIMLMPDMTTLDDETPAALAAAVDTLGRYPAAFHLGNGRLVVSPFKAEAKTTDWWAGWLNLMKTSHSTSVAFVPTLLDLKRYADDFAPISYGLSEWGLSSPATNQNGVAHAAVVHGLGKIFMAPAKVQDERPSQGEYQEAGNTETLRLSWRAVIDGAAEWVDMPTWNDYSEGTQIAPSVRHGWSYLDISSYYLSEWKTGTAPRIRRDGVYLTHRNQLLGARPVTVSTKPMLLRAGSTPARDTVEVLAFLKQPAAVVVRVGDATYTWNAPAGVSAHTFPLRTGQVSARVTRAGNVVTSVVSPYEVSARPPVQDMQYNAVSSLRG